VRALAERGLSARRIVGLLAATLGLVPDGSEASPRELVAGFSLDRIRRTATTLDLAQL
jgi:hypothetical protein